MFPFLMKYQLVANEFTESITHRCISSSCCLLSARVSKWAGQWRHWILFFVDPNSLMIVAVWTTFVQRIAFSGSTRNLCSIIWSLVRIIRRKRFASGRKCFRGYVTIDILLHRTFHGGTCEYRFNLRTTIHSEHTDRNELFIRMIFQWTSYFSSENIQPDKREVNIHLWRAVI